jgi:hypothetical protein
MNIDHLENNIYTLMRPILLITAIGLFITSAITWDHRYAAAGFVAIGSWILLIMSEL